MCSLNCFWKVFKHILSSLALFRGIQTQHNPVPMLSLSPSPFLISPNSLPSLIVHPISLRYSSYIFQRVFVDFLFCYIIDPIWKGLAIFFHVFPFKKLHPSKMFGRPRSKLYPVWHFKYLLKMNDVTVQIANKPKRSVRPQEITDSLFSTSVYAALYVNHQYTT